MPSTDRLFNCARCQAQVIICSQCDHGNLYCQGHCARLARHASLRQAGRKYQNTQRGRHNNAERQRRFRMRCRSNNLPNVKIVTHQGSPPPPSNDPLDLPFTPTHSGDQSPGLTPETRLACHFCEKPSAGFLRQGFLRRNLRFHSIKSPKGDSS